MLPIFNESETRDQLAALLDAPMVDWRRGARWDTASPRADSRERERSFLRKSSAPLRRAMST